MNNKVKFNICNCHYALQKVSEAGELTFEAPVAMPGAVSLALDPNGEQESFYADGIEYYIIANNMGYDGDARKIRHVLYNCSASRPKIEGKTNEESREVQTETLTVKARPMADGYAKAKTGNQTAKAIYDDWYKTVYLPTPKTEIPAAKEGQG